jgi:hypothetical protein
MFVRDSVHIPPDVIVNVPVELHFVNRRSLAGNWVTEAKEIKPGLIVARTIVFDVIVIILRCSSLTSLEGGIMSGATHFLAKPFRAWWLASRTVNRMTSLHVTDTQLGQERARTPPTVTDADRR